MSGDPPGKERTSLPIVRPAGLASFPQHLSGRRRQPPEGDMRRASLTIAIGAGVLGVGIGAFAAGRASAGDAGQTLLVIGAALAAVLAIVATYVTFRLSTAMATLTEQLQEAATST